MSAGSRKVNVEGTESKTNILMATFAFLPLRKHILRSFSESSYSETHSLL